MITKAEHQNLVDSPASISGFDTAVAYRRLRRALPDDALTMSLQLSLSPLPVALAQTKQRGMHIATTLAALTGPTGCLPPVYETTALEQAHNRNHAYADFIALFQRHLADLYIEASAKYSAHKQNRWRDKDNNAYLKAIMAMAGLSDDTRPDLSIRYAALFADNRRNAASLKAMLEDLFQIPVTIAEFQPCWQKIPEDERSFLNGRYQLGADCCIGASVQNAASHFRVVLGAMTYTQFRDFLPGAQKARCLAALIQLYCGVGLTFDIRLILKQDEIPQASLSGKRRLGYDLWLESRQPRQHHGDAVFDGRSISATPQQDIYHAS